MKNNSIKGASVENQSNGGGLYSGIFDASDVHIAILDENWPSNYVAPVAEGGGGSTHPLTPPSEIGESFEGGYYAGMYSVTGTNSPTHFLVVAPKAYEWYGNTFGLVDTSVATSRYDGNVNMQLLNNANYPLFQAVANLNIGGKTDWYIASEFETVAIMENFISNEATMSSYSGVNPYKMLRSNVAYGNGFTPWRTPAVAFQDAGDQKFVGYSYYMTSTQSDAETNKYKAYSWNAGGLGNENKTLSTDVYTRPIRKVPISNYFSTYKPHIGPYRYWRWRITALKSGTTTYNTEFKFQINGIDVNSCHVGVTVPGGFDNGSSVSPELLVNNDFTSLEHFDFYFGSLGYTDYRFDFYEPVSFSGYRWRTPNSNAGDAKSWTIQASEDNTNWTVVHTVTNYTSPTSRNVWSQTWDFA